MKQGTEALYELLIENQSGTDEQVGAGEVCACVFRVPFVGVAGRGQSGTLRAARVAIPRRSHARRPQSTHIHLRLPPPTFRPLHAPITPCTAGSHSLIV